MRTAVISLGAPTKPLHCVMIVDAHRLYREALAMTLATALKIRCVATEARLADALATLRRDAAPDAILLDLAVPDARGVAGLARLRAAAPGAPLIAVGMGQESRSVAAALAAGAAGYIPKESPREVFVRALSEIWAGATFVPDGYTPPDPTPRPPTEPPAAPALTAQQSRILGLVREGKLAGEIARDLGIAETTVKAHITAILRTLHARSGGLVFSPPAPSEERPRR